MFCSSWFGMEFAGLQDCEGWRASWVVCLLSCFSFPKPMRLYQISIACLYGIHCGHNFMFFCKPSMAFPTSKDTWWCRFRHPGQWSWTCSTSGSPWRFRTMRLWNGGRREWGPELFSLEEYPAVHFGRCIHSTHITFNVLTVVLTAWVFILPFQRWQWAPHS